MPDLTTLIERLEAAKEGSRELDREIAFAVGWTTSDTGTYRWICPHGRREIDAPGFTWSLNAALSLVPEGFCYDLRARNVEGTMEYRANVNFGKAAGAPTAPLALTIAALKARQSDAR